MAYDEKLAARIRARFKGLKKVEEKQAFGGLTFMFNDKMCVGIIKDEMMCRIDPALHDDCIKKKGCRTMDFTNRPMKGFIMVNESGMRTEKEFEYWVSLALDYNQTARSSKTKRPVKK